MNFFNYNRPIQYLSRSFITAVALGAAVTALAQSATGQADRKEAAFIKDAAQGGQAEVQLGQLAQQKSQNDQVKQFGQHLQQDHSQANQELMQIAQKLGVTVPTGPDRKEARHAEKLQDKTGADFDKAFVEHAIQDHQKDITKFQQALQDVKNPELKAFIQKSIPKLTQHLQMARTTGTAVGVDQKTLTAADRFLSQHGGQAGSDAVHSQHTQGLGTSAGSVSGSGGTTDQAPPSGANQSNQPERNTSPK